MTTTPITSITDELLAEIERDFSALTCSIEFGEETTRKAAGVCLMATELRRLRAENEALKTDLKTSRADEMQAMRWLTEMRFAAGDDGKLMLPELAMHIAILKKEAARYQWLLENADMMHWENMLHFSDLDGIESVSAFIDTAMQSNTEGN
jgi:hypothetical protein